MTTQDTHHEHNDADASMDAAVVGHPSAPENEMTAASTSSENSLSAVTAGEEDTSSSVSASDGADKVEAQTQPAASIEAEPASVLPEASIQIDEAPEAPVAESSIESAAEAQEAPSALEAVLEVAETQQLAPVEQTAEAPEAAVTPEAPETAEAPEASDASDTEHAASVHMPEVAQQTDETQHIDHPLEEQQDVLAELSAALSEALSTMDPVILDASTTTIEGDQIQSIEESLSLATGEVTTDSKAEEVRPFTDFIAEFRQAEAALRDSQVEALSILSSVAADLAFAEPQGETTTTFEEGRESDSSETTDKQDGVHVKIDETNVSSSSPEHNVQAEAEPATEKNIPQPTQPTQPAPRPVSPLLRPASRLRLPRHGVTRHQREEAAANENQASTEAQPKVESQPARPASTEPGTEATPPRPARRYRFDRPAAINNGANGSSPSAQTPASTDSQSSSALNGAGGHTRPEEAPAVKFEAAPPVTEQLVEPPIAKSTIQETETPAPEPVRRRHNSHKEQPAIQQAVEPVLQEAEPAPQAEDVAPEDLPPLEYSELQKASSRRRRRHRSGSSSVPSVASAPTSASSPLVQPVQPVQPIQSVQPAVPVQPVAQSATPFVQPPVAPIAPISTPPAARSVTSDPSQAPYTIVSGYTVNQMNQGNDLSGPFMGPDPSPARGSVMTRDGRNVRAETRTAQPSAPIYPPSRSVESGLSTAAMTQFANIVSQALQTQTDRMVSEFRRISQAPTNVSVTLPPFPSTERVGVFVDVANLLYSARTLRIGVDFGKLLDFLRGNRRLVRAHAYCPTSPQPGDEQMFLQAVKGLGYRITTKNYKTFSSGAKKADLDLDLCMDVVRLVDGGAVDCVVLVSGDSDFMPMLDYCSDHGVRVEVAAFDEAMSATLRQSCDLFINLSMLEEIRA